MKAVSWLFVLLLSILFCDSIHARADETSDRSSNKFLLRQFDLPRTAPTVRIIKLSQSLLNKNRRKSSKKSRKHSSEEASTSFSMSTEGSFEFEH